MSRAVVAWSETTEELEGRYRAEPDVERRKRLGALWRVRAGDRVADAGRAARVGVRTVERWLGWYRAGGLAEVLRRNPSWARRHLSRWTGCRLRSPRGRAGDGVG